MMDERDIAQIRKLVREEFWELLDAEVLPVLKDYIGIKLDASKVVETKPAATKEEASIPETLFDWLTWLTEKGEKLGIYEVAYQAQHLRKEWQYVFGILENNHANINNSFHPEGYAYRYWIYPEKYEDRVFRKKLDEKEA